MSESKLGTQLLLKQYRALSNDPPDGIYVGLVDDDIYHWEVMMTVNQINHPHIYNNPNNPLNNPNNPL